MIFCCGVKDDTIRTIFSNRGNGSLCNKTAQKTTSNFIQNHENILCISCTMLLITAASGTDPMIFRQLPIPYHLFSPYYSKIVYKIRNLMRILAWNFGFIYKKVKFCYFLTLSSHIFIGSVIYFSIVKRWRKSSIF